jgi:hypothetical protein
MKRLQAYVIDTLVVKMHSLTPTVGRQAKRDHLG